MSNIRYANFVKEQLMLKSIGVPFTAEEITEKAAASYGRIKKELEQGINLALNRLVGSEILRLSKGVYYRPKKGVFGFIPLSYAETIYKENVETKDGIIGYVTGPTIYQKLGFTTQISKYSYYATNNVKGRDKVVTSAGIVLRPPNTHITHENYRYLQFLDLLENKDDVSFEIDDVHLKFAETIANFNLDFSTLLGYANLYYKKKVVNKLIDIATLKLSMKINESTA